MHDLHWSSKVNWTRQVSETRKKADGVIYCVFFANKMPRLMSARMATNWYIARWNKNWRTLSKNKRREKEPIKIKQFVITSLGSFRICKAKSREWWRQRRRQRQSMTVSRQPRKSYKIKLHAMRIANWNVSVKI